MSMFDRFFGRGSDGNGQAEDDEVITGDFHDELPDDCFEGVDETRARDEPRPPESDYLPSENTYQVLIEDTERAGDEEVKAHTVEEGPVAGRDVREVWESAINNPEKEFWVGYDETGFGGFDGIPIRFQPMRRHVWISGTTGSGKTTVLQNKSVYHAFAGHGFCNIDPKASGDTLELLQRLPRHRLEDVVYLEPGSSQYDRGIGINMLDMPAVEDPMEREKEIEARLQNLVAIFDNDEYWGPTMAAVTESMGRAMLKYNAEVALDPDRDGEEKYSIIDMFFILLNQERRAEFAAGVEDPYISEFLEQIAAMDDDQLWPLLKRIKRWTENGVIRKIIAQRETTVDWDEIVDEGKILIVRLPVDSEDVHQMVTLTVLRNLWSAKKRQNRDEDRERTPFFLHVDEFEKVANDNLAMEDMLVRARSFWLSVTLATQYPGQIGGSHPQTLRAMDNNCNTLLAMRTGGEEDAGILMSNFDGYDANDLQSLDNYRAWTKILLDDGSEDSPVNFKTFPPYPPLWKPEHLDEIIEYSLYQYGRPVLTEEEICDQLKFGSIGDLMSPEAVADFSDDVERKFDTETEFVLDMVPEGDFLEGIYAAQVIHADEETPVSQDLVEAELEKRIGDVGFDSEISNAFEEHDLVKASFGGGESRVGLTEQGRNTVFSHDTGSSASGGGASHRWVLKESYRAFTALGALTSLPTQEGDELPDGLADLPIDPMDAATPKEVREREAQLHEDYPRLYELSKGRDIAIEAETSTITKPAKTLTNLRKAIESTRTCIFTCKDATFDDVDSHGFGYWPYRGERLLYAAADDGRIDHSELTCVAEVYDSGERRFYNHDTPLRTTDGHACVMPAFDDHEKLLWRESGTGVVALSKRTDAGLTEVAVFDSLGAVESPSMETVLHRAKVDDEWVVKRGAGGEAEVEAQYDDLDALKAEWTDLKQPFIPDHEFPRMPTEDDFAFVVFPDEQNPEYDTPQVYEHGEVEPLFDEWDHGDGAADSVAGDTTDSTDTNDGNVDVDDDDMAEEENGYPVCPECGGTAFSESDQDDVVSCDECGHTPPADVRELLCDDTGDGQDIDSSDDEATDEFNRLF